MAHRNSRRGRQPKREKWWTRPKDKAHDAVVSTMRHLDEHQRVTHERNLHHIRLYSNRLAGGLTGNDYNRTLRDDRLRLNVVKAVADTALATIATSDARIMTLGKGGNYAIKQRARGLTKFGDGIFHQTEHYDKSLEVFQDGIILGTGLEKIFPDFTDNRIKTERVFPEEILVDDTEAKYGPRAVRQLFQHKEMQRDTAIDVFGNKFKAKLANATLVRESHTFSETISDPISVVEAWYLPSYKGAGDGRHVIGTDTVTLFDEPWELTSFPFAQFRWTHSPLGFWGMGLAEELSQVQIEVNYLLQKIQKLMTLATTQVWVEKNALAKSKLNNEDMGIKEYASGSRPPIFQTVAAVSPEYFQHLDRLWNRAFEVAGISQLSATSKKPAGLESGEALRAFQEVQTKRFQHVEKRWQKYHVDSFSLMVHAARQLDTHMKKTNQGSFSVLTKDRGALEEINFSKVDLEDDSFIIQAYPTSLLPAMPAGKIEALKQLGAISPLLQESMVRDLDYPDVESALKRVNAPIEILDLYLHRMLDKGIPMSPHSFIDADLAARYMTLELLRAEIDGVPEKNLELVRNFLEQIEVLEQRRMLAQQAVAAASAPGTPGAVPPGLPAAPGGAAGAGASLPQLSAIPGGAPAPLV